MRRNRGTMRHDDMHQGLGGYDKYRNNEDEEVINNNEI